MNIIQFYKNIYVHFILDAYTTEIVYELRYEVTMDTYFQVTSYTTVFLNIILQYFSIPIIRPQTAFIFLCLFCNSTIIGQYTICQ